MLAEICGRGGIGSDFSESGQVGVGSSRVRALVGSGRRVKKFVQKGKSWGF